MSAPVVFTNPDSRGSAIHPLLLALHQAAPSLVKAVASSQTDDSTLSFSVKKAWGSLGSENSAQAVWDLIGESTLIPVDSVELLSQMCDLFDAELDDAAAKALEYKSVITIESGARVKDSTVAMSYTLPLSIPARGDAQDCTLSSLIASNFATEKIDFMFPDDIEPIESNKFTRLTSKFGEALVIQLQRYRYDLEMGVNAKIYERVTFAEHLSGEEFAKYAKPDCAKSISGSSLDLVAVLTHHDMNGYGLLLRPNAKGAWFKCCDSSSSEKPVETTLESVFGGDPNQAIAYMLFYKVTAGTEGVISNVAKRLSTNRLSTSAKKPAEVATPAAVPTPTPIETKSGGGGCCTVQ